MVQSTSISSIVIAGAIAAAITMTAAFAQSTTGAQSPPANPAGSTQRASSQPAPNAEQPQNPAAQNFLIEHEIGHRFHFDPSSLPPPKTGPIVTDRSLIVPYSGQRLEVPPGFTAAPFATGLANPRRLLVLANGDVLVAEQSAGYVTLLRDDGTGHAVWIDRHVEDLNKPYGLAWQGDHLLVTDQDGIWKVPHVPGALRAGRPVPPQRADQLPADQRKPVPGAYGAELITKKGVFGIVQGHQNRDIKIDPKTGELFVGVGSAGNLGVEPPPKATIQRFDADGSNQITYASGTRNATALAFQPETGDLWALVQERDGMGDNLPSDYLIRVRQGGFYGWPYAYIGPHPQPGFASSGARQGQGDDHPRSVVSGALVVARPRLLRGQPVPRAVQGSAVCRAERLVEPIVADRLQDRPGAVQGRQARGLLPEFRDRLLDIRRTARRGLGPPGGARRGQGRRLARRRRHRRHDLAHRLHRRPLMQRPHEKACAR